MARTGLTKSRVREVRAALLAEGRHPSADAVRHALGDTGSKSTIHKYLKELAGEAPVGAARRDDTASQLHELVEQLADELHTQAERRVAALVAQHERALREKDEELADLRRTVAALQAKVGALEGKPARPQPRERSGQPAGRAIGGFGNFSGLLANSRCGRGETSAFSIVLAGGRSDVLAYADPPAPPA